MTARPIVFLPDYGLDDEFVGVCHGVVARLAPDVNVIDLTHAIRRQDVASGALALGRAFPCMPADAGSLAVGAPGVGGERLPLALETSSGAFMVGPDNGLLSIAWKRLGGVKEAHAVESRDGMLATAWGVVPGPLSRTFPGRDIFAPAAAHLAIGRPLADLGPEAPADRLARISFP